MKHRILVTALLCTTLTATAMSPAFAETTTTTTPAQGRQARLEAITEQMCEQITARVAEQRANLDERAAAVQERFENQDARLTELEAKASELGVDTTNFENYLAIWSGYTDETTSKRNEITSTIDSGVSAFCDGDREGGRTYFAEAKSLVGELKDVRIDRRQYWLDTIAPEIRSIRDELRTLRIEAS